MVYKAKPLPGHGSSFGEGQKFYNEGVRQYEDNNFEAAQISFQNAVNILSMCKGIYPDAKDLYDESIKALANVNKALGQ